MENNIYTGKTVEEAITSALTALNLTREQAEITVIEEGKRKLIGGVRAQVKVVKKLSDGERALEFVEGLISIIGVNAACQLKSDEEKVEINLTSLESSRIIGHHGESLDAIQTLAGAVANIGRDEYKKVIVDCENYRENREQTLIALANKLAKKAVEKRRRVSLEPMNPYERRIIHSALSSSEEVKTISDGKEPYRYVVIVPNNERTFERRERHDRGFSRNGDRRNGGRDNGRNGGDRRPRSSDGVKTAKKEIRFGTFLGNSGNKGEE
ncbi:MAG: RNA-binding cell elongation regulator Jag/EloR [Candidatus Coproplasma sp.]